MARTYRKENRRNSRWRVDFNPDRKLQDKDMWPKGAKDVVIEDRLTGYSDEGGGRKDSSTRRKIRRFHKRQLRKEVENARRSEEAP